MIRPVVLAGAVLLLGGCAQTIAENRVRAALVDAGVAERNADCMAQRMVDRLTIQQLRRLEALRTPPEQRGQPVTLPEYVERVRRVGDAEVVAVTASSAALCATGLAAPRP
ncbi:hypothetical protein EYB45_05010 [Erythrobacteraceae bacterium CFH 75059]|uniref:hypothetical protein n=1 Tax=Qipengyuania thermophila TaxID=2509361 RepID=UPI00101EEC2D|nr:hypothetical protein [Qipengyuania thermophila]TCD04902.1 hypothetical protein EYB45_05010 [Erythrobacteraceae bacterium CFH 75059]